MTWNFGNVTLSGSWTHAAGTFDVSTPAGEDGFVVGGGVFVTDGASARVRKLRGAALVVAVEWDVQGGASVEVKVGAMVLLAAAGNWSAGNVALTAGALLVFRSGVWQLGTVSGNGTLSVAGAVVSAVAPSLDTGGALKLSAGSLLLAGASATRGSVAVTGGLLSVGAATEIGGVFTHSGGTVTVATGVALVLNGGGAISADLTLGGNESIVAFQGGAFVVRAPASVTGVIGSSMAVKGLASVELLVPVSPKALTVSGNGVLTVNLSGVGASSFGPLTPQLLVMSAGRISVVANLTLTGALLVTQNASFSLAAPDTLTLSALDCASFATAGNVLFDGNSTLDILVGDVWVNRSGTGTLSASPSFQSNPLAVSSTASSYAFAGEVVLRGGSLNVNAPFSVPSGSWTVNNGRLQLLSSAVINAPLFMKGGTIIVATDQSGVAVYVTVAALAQTNGFLNVAAGATLAVDPSASSCFITSNLVVEPGGTLVLPREACAQSPTAAPTATPTQLVSRC